jgi:LPXTG-site transpeptidase (sortase) family protein
VTGAHSAVGTYTITCNGGVDDNYVFSYMDGILTVNTVTLTVTANDKLIQLGAADPVFTFQYSGFTGIDDETVLTAQPTCRVTVPHTIAGAYPITCSGGEDENYTFHYVDGSLIVDSAPIILANGITTNAGILTKSQVVKTGITQFTVTFNEDVFNVPGTDPEYGDSASNPANYMLIRDNGDGFQTTSCAKNVDPADTSITIDSATYSNNNGAGPFVTALGVNGGFPLSNGMYALYVCGTTSITDILDPTLKLAGDGVTPATDFQIDFSVQLQNGSGGNAEGGGDNARNGSTIELPRTGLLIPVTGFAPGIITTLPVQTEELLYDTKENLRLEIPTLSINQPIVGIQYKKNSWDVTWLGSSIGYLEGSAYPTLRGNTILTGHSTDPNGNVVSFGYIKDLVLGDKIMIHSYNQVFVYQIQENKLLAPSNVSALFKHENYDWVTLVTCENYNKDLGKFVSRRVVRAVLISVISEK